MDLILPPIISAVWKDAGHLAAQGIDADGIGHFVLAGDPRLQGIEVAEYVVPPVPLQRVRSVPTLAWRRAMRATPSPTGTGTALELVLAAAAQDPELQETLDWMSRAERADMVQIGAQLGITPEQIDAVMTLAATFADPADVVWEIAA
jgi:hypothetical protein